MRRALLACLASAIGCQREAPKETAPSGSLPPSVAAATASASGAASAPSAPAPVRREPWNVLLISIDCLRQDMPWNGYPKPIAPNLTKLAGESVVYTHAYSVSSYTAKSVGAFLTSRYPSSLYRSGYFFTDYPKSNLFLAEVLHEQGIRSLAVHAHLYFGRGKQLDQGFDVWELVPGIRFDPETDNNVTSPKMTDVGIRELGKPENTSKQFFAWLHYTDPHDVYETHTESPDFGKDNRGRYDSEVFFTDLHVGRLLDFAKTQPWWDKTVLIVTADHGEAFGEHGMYKHAFWLWEILVRVPLIVHVPGNEPRRIDVKRSQIDLAPTVLDLMRVTNVPSSFVGRSMLPEIEGRVPAEDRDPIVLDLPEDSHNPKVRAIVRGDSKLIVYGEGRKELYDLAADPGELHDLAKSEPEQLASMKAEFDRTWSAIPFVEPYGGNKLREGRTAKGPMGP
jgi:arylsulfatase A-like enzyme